MFVTFLEDGDDICFLPVVRKTWPVCNDLLNIISSIGEIWWLNSFRTVGGIVSGPAALWDFRLDSICWIPVAEMLMSVLSDMDE